jgi:hypothetical protein
MEGFADIEGPVRIGLLFWVLLGVTGLFVTGLIVWLISRLRQRPPRPPAPPPKGPSAIEVALSRLRKLRSEAAHIEADPFTVEVSDIVRHYLEATLHLPAREQTTEEFLHKLEFQAGLPDAIPAHMPGFLEACDRVKFARQSLQAGERERLIETASTVINTTEAAIHLRPDQPISPPNP